MLFLEVRFTALVATSSALYATLMFDINYIILIPCFIRDVVIISGGENDQATYWWDPVSNMIEEIQGEMLDFKFHNLIEYTRDELYSFGGDDDMDAVYSFTFTDGWDQVGSLHQGHTGGAAILVPKGFVDCVS